MKTLEKIEGFKRRSLRMIVRLLMTAVVFVGFIACGEDPEPPSLPVLPFPSPLAPSMVGSEWANANALPAGTNYFIGKDSAGTEIYVPLTLEEYILIFKDTINLEIQRKVSNTGGLVATMIFDFRYVFDRYTKKGRMKATDVGGLTTDFYMYTDEVSNTPRLVFDGMGNEFKQLAK
jgi:hypothetical protein